MTEATVLLTLIACGTPVPGTDSGGVDPAALDLDAGPGDFLYTTEHILDFAIELDDAAVAALAAEPKEDVHATFAFLEERYDVGLHLKGSSSGSFRTLDEKAAFKIDFHEWDREQTFHGVRRLTLNNMIQDGTMSSEHVAYELFRALGVPAARHGYARVTVNGEWYGLYGVVESMDEQFLDRWWPGDDGGNLYEGGYGADLYSHRDDNFTVQESGTPTPPEDLLELIDAVEGATPETFMAMLEANFDADQLLGMWAGELVLADDDGYSTLGNNFQLYHAPEAGRWTMIPWGPDQCFEDEFSVYMEYDGRLAEDCAASAECKARLDAAMLGALDTWDAIDLGGFTERETARIEADCRADPRSNWGDYGCRDALAALRAWMAARPDVVRAEIEGGGAR